MDRRVVLALRVVSLFVMVAMATWVACPITVLGAQPLPEAGPTTDLWKFTFTETGSSASQETYTFNAELTQYGDLVFGSVISDRWVGKKEMGKLSITILSQPAKGNKASQGALAVSGAFDLRKGASNAWKGEGYRMTPGADTQAPFQTFTVTATKLPAGSEERPYGIDWCSLFHFQDLFNYIYSGIPVNPIQGCSLDHNGDGYYLFGTYAPGSGGSVAAATVYFPYEVSGCNSRNYGFAIEAGDKYQSSDAALQALKNDTAFMNYIQLSSSDVDDLALVYTLYGDFAVSIGYNSNTKSVNVYISTASGSQSGLCDAVQNSSVLASLKQRLDKGGGVFVYCGSNIQDTDHLEYHWDPTSCATPMLFIYCFGTIHVTYD